MILPSSTTTVSILLPLSPAQAAITQIVTATSTIPPTTITLAAATSAAPSTSSSFTNGDDFQFAILNSTNLFRYLHPAPYLSYNNTLASFAQSYSKKCTWSHNSQISKLGYGENLAKGYSTPAEAVDAWGNEAALFSFSGSSYTGFTEETGHFTQLVWRGTSSVGCGWTDCSGKNGNHGILLVCNYFPAGNIMASGDSGDEYVYFKQDVVPQRQGGSEGFDAQDAGRGVGGPSGTATESVAGTVTANAAVAALRADLNVGKGTLGSLVAVGFGVVLGMNML